ncbi:hypothetical protein V2J09_006527 [Rumex salicifolius]
MWLSLTIFVRQNVQNGVLRITHVSTNDQLADVLTKPLHRQQFELNVSKLGLCQRPFGLRGRFEDITVKPNPLGDMLYSMDNRGWMYDRRLPNDSGWKNGFIDGVEIFIEFATSQVHLMDGSKINCPCSKCKNGRFQEIDDVRVHLYTKGFVDSYYSWTEHGELPFVSASNMNDMNIFGIGIDMFDNSNPAQRMVFDAPGPSFLPPPRFDHNSSINDKPNTSHVEMSKNDVNLITDMSTTHQSTMMVDPDSSLLSEHFSDVLRAANQPLYQGSCLSQLAAVGSFIELKTKYNMSQARYNALLQKVSDVLPVDNNLPKSFYEQKKLTRELRLPQQKMHM